MEQLFSDFIVHLDATSDTDNHNYQGGQSEAFEQRGEKLITVLGMKNEKLIKT